MTPARPYERPDAVAGIVPDLPIRWAVSHPRSAWYRSLSIAVALLWIWSAVTRPSVHAVLWAALSLVPALSTRSETRLEMTDDGTPGRASFLPRPFFRWRDVARAEIGPERIVLRRASGRFAVKLDLPEDERLRARIRAAVLRETPVTAAIEESAG